MKYHGKTSAVYKHLRYDLGLEKVLKVSMHEMRNGAPFTVVQLKNPNTEEGKVRAFLDEASYFM